jgi:hypothetical protein
MDVNDLSQFPPWEWTDAGKELVLATLRDRTAAERDRRLAAELLGDLALMNDDIADALLAILADPAETPFLRGRAAISLGPVREELWLDEGYPFPDEDEAAVSPEVAVRIAEGLHGAFADPDAPKEVRRRALEASIRSPEDWHANAVGEAYASGDAEWRITALFCMQHTDGFEDEILASLTDEDPRIEREAVRAAGEHGLTAAWKHVRAIVEGDTADRGLLLAAIGAVGTIRPRQAWEVFLALADEDDEEIQAAIEEALLHARLESGGEDYDADFDYDPDDEDD